MNTHHDRHVVTRIEGIRVEIDWDDWDNLVTHTELGFGETPEKAIAEFLRVTRVEKLRYIYPKYVRFYRAFFYKENNGGVLLFHRYFTEGSQANERIMDEDLPSKDDIFNIIRSSKKYVSYDAYLQRKDSTPLGYAGEKEDE